MIDTVFCSYSRRDGDVVLPIADTLAASGVKIWLDQSSIPVSVPWMDEITQAVRSAVLVVVFESLDWHSSPNCAVEVQLAEQLGKPVLYVDPRTQSAVEIQELVTASLQRVQDSSRVGAELLARSFRWAHGGRRAGDLAAGKNLQAYRRLQRDPGVSLPSDADTTAFLRASRRRERRRRTLGVTAAVITSVMFLVPNVLTRANDQVEQQLVDATTTMDQQIAMQRATAYNGYAGLAQALELTKDVKDSFTKRSMLTLALATILPSSYVGDRAPDSLSHLARKTSAPAGGLVASVSVGPGRVDVTDGSTRVQRFNTQGEVTALAWSPDGRKIAIADSSDVRVMDVQRGNEVLRLRGVGALVALRWAGVTRVEGWTADGHRATWRLEATQTLAHDPRWWFTDTAAGQDGTIAAVSRDGAVVTVAPDGRPSTITRIEDGPPTAISAGPHGDWFIAVTGDKPALVQVSAEGSQRRIASPSCFPADLAWSDLIGAVVVGCASNGYAVWQPSTGGLSVRPAPIDVTSVATAKDRVVLAGGPIEFAQLDAKGKVSLLRPGFPGCLGGSRKLVVVPRTGQIFNTGTGLSNGCAQRLTPTAKGVTTDHLYVPLVGIAEARGLAVSHDSSTLAIGTSEGSVWFVRPGDFALVQVSRGTGSEVRGIEFAADDKSVVVATRGGDIVRIPLDSAARSMNAGRKLAQERLAEGRNWGLYADKGKSS